MFLVSFALIGLLFSSTAWYSSSADENMCYAAICGVSTKELKVVPFSQIYYLGKVGERVAATERVLRDCTNGISAPLIKWKDGEEEEFVVVYATGGEFSVNFPKVLNAKVLEKGKQFEKNC